MRSIQGLRVILIQLRVAQADLGNGATRVWHWAHGVAEARQGVGVQVQRIDVARQNHRAAITKSLCWHLFGGL